MSIATAEISLSALSHNLEQVKRIAPNSQIAAMIKANAYGHGMYEIAKALQNDVLFLGVSRLEEALKLRKQGIGGNIVLLEGFFAYDDIDLISEYGLQVVIHSSEQIKRLKKMPYHSLLTVWFKIDSGMHRLGFHPEEALEHFQSLAALECIKKPINILTHFCCSDELDSPVTPKQIEITEQFINSIPDKSLIGLQSFAASGGIFAWPDSHRDIIRPGIVLYGASPFYYSDKKRATGHQLGLKPVMTFKSELIAVRTHKKGEAVGYGHTWTSPHDTKLGVVAVGYGDGYSQHTPAGTPVLVNGKRVPIVGRVSMDMMLVDLGLDSKAKIGDEVILWGDLLPVEEIANCHHTSPYELLTRLTSRVQLRYVR